MERILKGIFPIPAKNLVSVMFGFHMEEKLTKS